MDWLEKHGEQFLCKSIGVGRNMQKAYACQKSQDNFEKVVQVQFKNILLCSLVTLHFYHFIMQ